MSIVVLHFQALQVERSQLLTSSEIPNIDELARENQSVLGAEVPPLHATDGGHKAVEIERPNQLQLSPLSGSPVDLNQHYPRLTSPVEQPPKRDGPIASNADLAQHVDNPSLSVPSDPVVLHTGANRLSVDGYTSLRNTEAMSQLGFMEALPIQVVSSTRIGTEPPINTLGGFGINLPLHSPHQAAARMPAKSVCADVLTTELERLRKQTDQTNTAYEDTVSNWFASSWFTSCGWVSFRLFSLTTVFL